MVARSSGEAKAELGLSVAQAAVNASSNIARIICFPP
jgi:hypothetical protein